MEPAATAGQSPLKTLLQLPDTLWSTHPAPSFHSTQAAAGLQPTLTPRCLCSHCSLYPAPPGAALTPVFPALAQHVLITLIHLTCDSQFLPCLRLQAKRVCWDQAGPTETTRSQKLGSLPQPWCFPDSQSWQGPHPSPGLQKGWDKRDSETPELDPPLFYKLSVTPILSESWQPSAPWPELTI